MHILVIYSTVVTLSISILDSLHKLPRRPSVHIPPRTVICVLVTSSPRETMLAWDFPIICGGIAGECRCSALSARVNLPSLVLLRGLS